LDLGELESLVLALNLTESAVSIQTSHNTRKADLISQTSGRISVASSDGGNAMTSDEEARCVYLASLYKHDVAERGASHQDGTINGGAQEQDSLVKANKVTETTSNVVTLSTNISDAVGSAKSTKTSVPIEPTSAARRGSKETGQNEGPQIDDHRLLSLCKLAVTCQSSEDMVELISRPWRKFNSASSNEASSAQSRLRGPRSTSDREVRRDLYDNPNYESIERENEPSSNKWNNLRRKNLRDSLSLSLSKLCPLILFQLHEDDEQCTIVRDDTPPMLAVWGFATLFVTIVSFCSLIGLSIAPLIGQSAAADTVSSGSSTSTLSSESSLKGVKKPGLTGDNIIDPISNRRQPLEHQHKATLTVFEGLAVGSLVGSALFSLIPQAFELQERESNQSFLMKAFIIFAGIYLFFCSERIMRIILDTRQMKKRKKRLNNRSSTTAAAEPLEPAMVAQVASSLTEGKNCEPIPRKEISISHKVVGSRSLKHEHSQLAGGISRRENSFEKQEKLIARYGTEIRKKTNGKRMVTARSRSRKAAQGSKRRQKRRSKVISGQTGNIRGQRKLSRLETNFDEYYQIRRSSSINSSSSLESQNSSFAHMSRDNYNISSFKFDDENDSYCSLTSENSFESSELESWFPDNESEMALDCHHNDVWGSEYPMSNRIRFISIEDIDMKNVPPKCNEPTKSARDSCEELALSDLMNSKNRSRLNSGDFNDLLPSGSKREISTVAWMIILGDGLHNFIDGISIGAAFSESILSGVSISVAVICEEFPHELGDFAVLVSSGMTVRQALGYNFLSACTCYLGMAIGIILGDVNDGASYISALAAGVFLYIALVDMMGELSAALEASSRNSITKTLKLLLLQNLGIFIGISIIFVLSFIDF